MKREKAKKRHHNSPKQTIELQTTFNPTLLKENDNYETLQTFKKKDIMKYVSYQKLSFTIN